LFEIIAVESVLFIPYIIESHLIPTLGMARLLRQQYNVVYALPKKFQRFPELYGYNYINLESVPFAFGYEAVLRKGEGSKSVYRDSFRDRKNGRIANHRRKKLNAITGEINPVFIFSDILSSTDFILLYPYLKEKNAGFAIHNPMLSTYTMKGVPRIGSSLTINQTAKTRIENSWVKLMTKIFNSRQFILYPFSTDRDMARKEFAKNNIPGRFKPARDNHFTKMFNHVPEIITAPLELEFLPQRKKDYQFYVGPLMDGKRIEKNSREEISELINRISEWKKTKETKIVFCAFGTMSQKNSRIIIAFIEKLLSMFSKHPSLKLLCAFNDKNDSLDKSKLPGNVFLFTYLPQLSLLPYTDLFITHAGLGSVKEAIFHGVPMLAYPFTKSWDSNGNATKIAYHKLGLRGDILNDNEEQIREKIFQLLESDEYRNTIQSFRRNMLDKYSEKKFLELFEEIRQTTNWNE